MTEPPVISDVKSRQTIFLIWAIVATVLALVSTGLAVFFFLQPREGRHELAGWSRWETSAGGNGHWYKAVASSNSITWTEADQLARAQGGYLATITSAAENDFVFNLVNAPEFFWNNGKGPLLGGFQQDRAPEPDGGWCWVSGDPWNYSNWHPTEPNNGRHPTGTEDRLQFYSGIPRTPGATWNDVNRNDTETGGYVIERND
jgi:hypothetical protein